MAQKINYIEPTSVQSNGIQIHYDGFGDWGNPKVLLISGQGAQMISWDEQFCESLASRGYCVIRFDNRDVGLSAKFDEAGIPDITVPFQKWLAGEPIPLIEAPYSLIDMAKDVVGLMNVLEISKAHLMGISMGGLVTQLVGIHFPDRVESLTLMATFAKSGEVISPDPVAAKMLVQSPAKSFEEGILRGIENAKVYRGSGFQLDEVRARRRLEAKRNRMYYPPGNIRQMAAVNATEPWFDQLAAFKMPVLIVHGDEDPLFPLLSGERLLEAIPGSKLMVIKGLGHAFPPEIWDRVIDWFVRMV